MRKEEWEKTGMNEMLKLDLEIIEDALRDSIREFEVLEEQHEDYVYLGVKKLEKALKVILYYKKKNKDGN